MQNDCHTALMIDKNMPELQGGTYEKRSLSRKT